MVAVAKLSHGVTPTANGAILEAAAQVISLAIIMLAEITGKEAVQFDGFGICDGGVGAAGVRVEY
jgi:hypothetical protein